MPTAHSLVAPTQKISDDAPYSIPPQNQGLAQPDARALTTRPAPGAPPPAGSPYARPPAATPVGTSPPHRSAPPLAAPSTPPGQRPASQPPAPRAALPQAAASSVASAPPRRRWGLILVVLVIDIGLAAAGVWMLTNSP